MLRVQFSSLNCYRGLCDKAHLGFVALGVISVPGLARGLLEERSCGPELLVPWAS